MLSSHQALAGARGQLYATLFTCDGRGDAGLLWLHESEGAGRAEWEAAFRTADKAVQIHGGSGYCRGVIVERIFRDSRALRIYEGTSEIQRNLIARALLRD